MTPFGSEGEVHVTKRFRGEPMTRDTTGCSGADGTIMYSNKNEQTNKQKPMIKVDSTKQTYGSQVHNSIYFLYIVYSSCAQF